MTATPTLTASPAAAASSLPSHAATILALLSPGEPVSIAMMARAIYGERRRPADWAASIRSTINRLRRAQERHGAVIVCEAGGYRRIAGPAAPIVLPGRFMRCRGFVPVRAPHDSAAATWAPIRRAA